MTGGGEDDPLMAALRALPGAPLPPAARVRALAHAEAELSRRPPGWWSWLRWLGTEALVPTVLVVAGLLYATGALRQLDHVYGPRSRSHQAADRIAPSGSGNACQVALPVRGNGTVTTGEGSRHFRTILAVSKRSRPDLSSALLPTRE